MTNSAILGFPIVDANQNQKEATIATGLEVLEAAGEDQLSKSMAAGDITLSAAEWYSAKLYNLTGSVADHICNVPATKRFVAFRNTGANTVLLRVTGGLGKAIPVQPANAILAYCDGADVHLISSRGNGAARTYTASQVLSVYDAYATIEMDVASGNVLTLPEFASVPLPVGVVVPVHQKGAGQTLITVAGSNATLHWPGDKNPKTRRQDSVVFLMQTLADSWLLWGDLG